VYVSDEFKVSPSFARNSAKDVLLRLVVERNRQQKEVGIYWIFVDKSDGEDTCCVLPSPDNLESDDWSTTDKQIAEFILRRAAREQRPQYIINICECWTIRDNRTSMAAMQHIRSGGRLSDFPGAVEAIMCHIDGVELHESMMCWIEDGQACWPPEVSTIEESSGRFSIWTEVNNGPFDSCGEA